MNFVITVYDTTGKILRTLSGSEYDLLIENVLPGEEWIAGEYEADRYYIVDGEAVQMPPRPVTDKPWRFDYATETWIDPRTPDDMWDELLRREAAAEMPLYEFLQACRREGFLSDASATAFPDGVWPPEWEDALVDYSPEQMTDTALKMKTGGVVRYTDGLIQAIIVKALQPGQDMHTVFGIVDPYNDP